MRIYTISHTDHGTGYTTTNVDNLVGEFEVEIEENGERGEFTEENISKVVESIKLLQPVKDGYAGAMVVFGPFIITAGEMSEEEYESMPEFGGW